MSKGTLISLMIIAVGGGWLLNTLHVIAGVDWIWTLALAAVGILMMAWTTFNKVSFIVGAFLIMGSLFPSHARLVPFGLTLKSRCW